jgi:hypothetical protein
MAGSLAIAILANRYSAWIGPGFTLLLLFICIACGTYCLLTWEFLLEWIQSSPRIRKKKMLITVLCSLLGAVIFGGITHAVLTPEKLLQADYSNALNIHTTIAGGDDYPKGEVGGIKWNKNYRDVRILINNNLNVPIEKVELFIRFDIHIADARQFGSSVPNLTVTPADSPVAGMALIGSDSSGNKMTLPITPVGPGINPEYHVICPRLSAKGEIRLIFATIAMNPITAAGPPQYATAAPRPPQELKIHGSYETSIVDGARRFPVEYGHSY